MGKKADFLTTAEAAAELGVSQVLIQKLARAGRIPNALMIGRDWLIPRASLAAVRDRPKKRGRPEGWRKNDD